MSGRKIIRVNFRANGEGLLECKNYLTTRCLGQPGLNYPTDSTIDPSFPGTKQNPHYSETYSCAPNDNSQGQCIMNFSILIWGKQGVYIHEWPNPATLAGNGGPTHGCIHLDPGKAVLVYNWVDGPTRLLISYPW
jgi:lipoprotein-anchoring transpeptidase ErfK/SrfK